MDERTQDQVRVALSEMRDALARMDAEAGRLRRSVAELEQRLGRADADRVAPEAAPAPAVAALPTQTPVPGSPPVPAPAAPALFPGVPWQGRVPAGAFPQGGPPAPGGWGPSAPGAGPSLAPRNPVRPRRPSRLSTQTVIAALGGATLLLGVAFLLVLAAQAGYFGPVARTIAAAVLAVALVAGGILLELRWRGRTTPAESASAPPDPSDRGVHVGALALVGTGIAAAVLDLVACSALYRWIPEVPALIGCGLLAAGGLCLARWWRSAFLTCLVTAGILLLSPLITERPVLGALVVVVAALATALCGRQGTAVLVARTVVPAVLLLWLGGNADVPHGNLVALLCVLALAAVGAAGAAVDTFLHPGEFPRAGMAAVPTAIPLLTAGGLGVIRPGWALHAVLAVAYLLAAALVAWSGRGREDERHLLGASLAISGTALLLTAFESVGDPFWSVLALMASASGYVVAAGLTRLRWLDALAVVMAAVGLVAYWVTVAVPLALVREEAEEHYRVSGAVLSLAAAGLVTAVVWWALRRPDRTNRGTILGLGAVGVLVSLSTALVAAGVALGRASGDPSAGFRWAHLVVTTLWTVVAAWLVLSRTRRLPGAHRVGLALGACALVKLFLLDLAELPGLLRVIAFLVVGAVLLAVGVRYSPEQPPRGPGDPGGHGPGGPNAPGPGPHGGPGAGAPVDRSPGHGPPARDVPPAYPGQRTDTW